MSVKRKVTVPVGRLGICDSCFIQFGPLTPEAVFRQRPLTLLGDDMPHPNDSNVYPKDIPKEQELGPKVMEVSCAYRGILGATKRQATRSLSPETYFLVVAEGDAALSVRALPEKSAPGVPGRLEH
jgi:hypothetical protein